MVAIDANILLRALVNDDPQLSKQANNILSAAKPKSLYLDRLILSECTYVMRSYYKFAKADIAEWLDAVVEDNRFHIPERSRLAEAVALFARHKPLSLEDCWLLAAYRAGHVTDIKTFDQPLLKSM